MKDENKRDTLTSKKIKKGHILIEG